MGSQVPFEQTVGELNDINNENTTGTEESQIKSGYDAKRRRQIEDYMDDRTLASQLKDTYDDLSW